MALVWDIKDSNVSCTNTQCLGITEEVMTSNCEIFLFSLISTIIWCVKDPTVVLLSPLSKGRSAWHLLMW